MSLPNPFPVVRTFYLSSRAVIIAFILLVSVTVAVGVSISIVERAMREGSARAADTFDLIVGAPGSHIDLVLSSVYLETSVLPLLAPDILAELLSEPQATYVAPLAFGDSVQGHVLVGTTSELVLDLAENIEGRLFSSCDEAVIGSNVGLEIGATVRQSHDHGAFNLPHPNIEIVGRLSATGTAWDNAVIVPVEQYWHSHNLPSGHSPGDDSIGAPFDPQYLSGVPAVVVKPATIASAYGLRSQYRSERSTTVFPAEALIQLYSILGDARSLAQNAVSVIQVVVITTIGASLFLIVQNFRRHLLTFRAIGASLTYIRASIWLYCFTILAVGIAAGLALGWGLSWHASRHLAGMSGIALAARIGPDELWLCAWTAVFAMLVSLLPVISINQTSLKRAFQEAS